MKRRDVLRALGGIAGVSAAGTWSALAQCSVSPGKPLNYTTVSAVCPEDLEAYFTEKRLRELVDMTKPLPNVKYEVAAFHYPCWHPCGWLDKYFGKGWTQFQSLRDSKPLYPGHLFPKYPLWGEYNEAEPEWAERENDAAKEHGIDVWMIDWYWQEGTMRCESQLEDGFLKARNRQQMKFALMWANHDWSNGWQGSWGGPQALMSRQRHSEEDMMKVMDYCIEHYFHQPNYWRIDGGLVFGVFSIASLLRDMSPEQWLRVSARMRERVAKAGLGELHFQASYMNDAEAARVKELGFQSATLYNTHGTIIPSTPEGGRVPFGAMAARTVSYWRKMREQCAVPFFPDCTVGWDNSPRIGASARMVTQRSPDQYERLMVAAKYFLAESGAGVPKIVFLSSWNEWTEDHVLLPDTVYGYSYLEAVRRVFRG
jgi:hypothetical protein